MVGVYYKEGCQVVGYCLQLFEYFGLLLVGFIYMIDWCVVYYGFNGFMLLGKFQLCLINWYFKWLLFYFC